MKHNMWFIKEISSGDRSILPYVLNPLILLKLKHKLLNGVEINNNNITSKLQYILKKCNFIGIYTAFLI